MRDVKTKHSPYNCNYMKGIEFLVVVIVLALLSSACVKEPEKARTDQQAFPSDSDAGSERSSEPNEITIHLDALPGDAIKLEMVLIQAGSFKMGSSMEERGRSDNEWPVHEVSITKPFYMGKYEVTQAQWDAVMGKNPSYFHGRPNHPVEKVTWRACQKFIKRLDALGQGTFRLPTEAEWEYACRAGSETQFFFGDSLENADKYMWWEGNNEPRGTKEVGRKLPNPRGLYDMHGNVQEWCADRWALPNERGSQMDPLGPSAGSSFFFLWTNRVFRGGGFRSGAYDCRASYRNGEQSIDYHYSLGFRLVRELH